LGMLANMLLRKVVKASSGVGAGVCKGAGCCE